MKSSLVIIAGVPANTYVGSGAAQILVPKDRYRGLRGSSQHWADDFQPGHLTAIGTLKIIGAIGLVLPPLAGLPPVLSPLDRKSTRLNSSHVAISYAVFCLKKKKAMRF